MNIDGSYVNPATPSSSQLELLYSTVPQWREILAAVKAGHSEFVDMLANSRLLDEFGLYSSEVHAYEEIEVHAFILGIVSTGHWDEVQTKSYLTYASHWIDDFFDCPQRVRDPSQLMDDRGDIRRALANMGRIGEVGFAMANRARHPEAVYKALQRMLYGGLVQRSNDRADRHTLVEEYRDVAARFVNPQLIEEIRRLQPQAYWTTNKTVLELLAAAEKEVDFSTTELWSMVYAPALYYQDAEEERIRGELSFSDEEMPRLADMLEMIRLGATHIDPHSERNHLYLRQLEFAALSIPNLPDQVAREYRSLWERQTHVSISSHVTPVADGPG